MQRCRNDFLHVNRVVVGQLVDFVGGTAGGDVRGNVVQHLGSEFARDAHLFDVGGGFYFYGHRSEEHTSELQSQSNLVCRLLLEKKKKKKNKQLDQYKKNKK